MSIPEVSNTITATLQNYQTETEAEVYRILDFWVQRAQDERGGFIGQMDSWGQVNPGAPKGSVLNARILWSFSAAYRHTHKEQYRQMADRAFDYILTYFIDPDFGGTYWQVSATGEPQNTRKQIYGLAFTIYGLSEYYLATKNSQALQVSQELFHWIEKHSYDEARDGYLEAFSREGELLEDLRLSDKDQNDPKTMNTHLHILEAYANLYRIWPNKFLKNQLKKLIQVFLNHIIDRETGHLKLFLSANWKPTVNLVSYGHDIEASWLLEEAAEVLGNPALLTEVKAVVVQMAQVTAEELQPDGSLYHEWNKDTNHYDTHREWWVSAEAMVGFFNAFALTSEETFLQQSLHSWQFIQKHMLDKQHGEWLWGVFNDYSPMLTEDKIGFWKCPYHNTRACLEVVNRCKTLLQ
ncbi:N-acyl-D-glucosamine 2-epimerase [Adhaeribacter arboris]|uniref:Cellobiose 2-epimerase n=1 Tax=Adhaeribacter arboris TaxID=2072846 RepID=A0A2T2YM46_9BACT|nr:AGE family epimerase/isomerase [Adhaeribacter arboris]PSR56583.1 N-acyl-D-glucosamine 2-epimerase [Adhaeribacter arboris]